MCLIKQRKNRPGGQRLKWKVVSVTHSTVISLNPFLIKERLSDIVLWKITPLFQNKEHRFTNYSPDKAVTQEKVTCSQLHDSLLSFNISRASGKGVNPFFGLECMERSKSAEGWDFTEILSEVLVCFQHNITNFQLNMWVCVCLNIWRPELWTKGHTEGQQASKQLLVHLLPSLPSPSLATSSIISSSFWADSAEYLIQNMNTTLAETIFAVRS